MVSSRSSAPATLKFRTTHSSFGLTNDGVKPTVRVVWKNELEMGIVFEQLKPAETRLLGIGGDRASREAPRQAVAA